MKKIFCKIKAPLVTACYAAAVIITLLYCLGLATYSGIMRKSGNIKEQALTLDDLTLYNMEKISADTAVATSVDPQMIFSSLEGTIQSVRIELVFSMQPGEMAMYYVTGQNEEFGQNKRVWAKETDDGVYVYNLPLNTKSLRLDPGNVNNNVVTVKSITVNPQKSFFSYFALSAGQLLALLVMPAFTAAVISYLIQCKRIFTEKRRKGKQKK